MADIFLFPSRREGLSLALMEAMANSLPVICSNIRGNRDLIQHPRGGFLVSVNEVKQWQMAIKRGIDKKRFWLEYGRYNQQRVKCSFSFSTIHEKMGELYFSN